MTAPAAHNRKFRSQISTCQRDGAFVDLTLEHEEARFEVHRVIVCSQSKVIHKACTLEFEDKSAKSFPMVDISRTEVEKLIDFFYTGSYTEDIDDAVDDEMKDISALRLHAKMFANGDRYDIPVLMEVAQQNFSMRCKEEWSSEEFLASIKEVYETTPDTVRALREVASAAGRPKLAEMLRDDAIAALCSSVLDAVPGFTKDLLHLYAVNPVSGYCSDCRSHQALEPIQVRCLGCRKGRGWQSTQ